MSIDPPETTSSKKAQCMKLIGISRIDIITDPCLVGRFFPAHWKRTTCFERFSGIKIRRLNQMSYNVIYTVNRTVSTVAAIKESVPSDHNIVLLNTLDPIARAEPVSPVISCIPTD